MLFVTVGFEFMFAQSDIPFSERPNLVAPRLAFELIGARPGRKLKDAKCQMLVIYAKDDDLLPPTIAKDIAEEAAGSKRLILLFLHLLGILSVYDVLFYQR